MPRRAAPRRSPDARAAPPAVRAMAAAAQVFMDDVFRRQAVTSLLESCDAQSSGQFLFLTPQDMSSMLDADSKPRHIFRMPDPRSD